MEEAIIIPESTKMCGVCGIYKLKTEYDPSPVNKDGLYSWCKPCRKESRKKWYQKNKTKLLKALHEKKELEKKRKEYEELAAKGITLKGRNRLREYRDIMKNKPISISDLIN